MAKNNTNTKADQQRLEDLGESISAAAEGTPDIKPEEGNQSVDTTPENVKGKEEKKSLRRKLADKLIADDNKKKDKQAERQRKAEEKAQAKANAPKKTWKDYAKTGAKVLGIAGAAAGATLLAVGSISTDQPTYIDDGTPTTYIPENTPVENNPEPVVVPETPSESANNSGEASSQE